MRVSIFSLDLLKWHKLNRKQPNNYPHNIGTNWTENTGTNKPKYLARFEPCYPNALILSNHP